MQKSMYKEALVEFKKEKEISKSDLTPHSMIIVTNALMGKRNEAMQMLDDFIDQSKHVYISPYFFAHIYVALGENDLALKWLEKAYEEHDIWLLEFKVDALFDNIHSDFRFKALLKKIGFEI